ncbi:MAG: bis(5'-nucleosyl)-tetraphosphatase (symmetrical) YqeK [Erysipelotrichaceae bacterium]|nr:bis(5'-nucleosyl)-tetraphosphatase (symmetrical) YqeK [Erysipelotrichaceae bacterium]
MKRAGLIISTFDPVNEGHLQLARVLKEKYGLSEVWFAAVDEDCEADFSNRYIMLKRALSPRRGWRTVNYANCRDRKSVLEKLSSAHRSVIFICPGHQTGDPELKNVTYVTEELNDQAAQVRKGDFRWIGKPVRRFIMEKGLYADSIATEPLKPHRQLHVRSVARLSAEIARRNHLDERKAWLAGLYHDIAKDLDDETSLMYMKLYYPNRLKENRAVWHQFVARRLLERYYRMTDEEILKAVENHCLGEDEAPLSMIIYCADKLEPLRGYDSSREIELCCRDLKKGFQEVHRQQDAYLVKTGVKKLPAGS